MEKILRHSVLRRNQLAKKARELDLKALRAEWREYNHHQQKVKNTVQEMIINERKSRREDWQLGPLAPNRDVGDRQGKFGTISTVLTRSAPLPKRFQVGPRGKGSDSVGQEDKNQFPDGEWFGEGLPGNLVVGDRVAIVNGLPGVKGMVGEVTKVDNSSQDVTVRDINKADVEVPSFMLSKKEKFVTTDIAVKMKDVRLVIPLQDPEAGGDRDHIVHHVYGAGPYKQRDPNSNLPRHTRYIGGVNEVIPWPEESSEELQATEVDTPRILVDQNTYKINFESPPLFVGAIDELRGKYSRTRKVYDSTDWMKEKVILDARQQWLKERVGLMAPKSVRTRSQRSRYVNPLWLIPTKSKKLVEDARKTLSA